MLIRECAPLCLTHDSGWGGISRGWARTGATFTMGRRLLTVKVSSLRVVGRFDPLTAGAYFAGFSRVSSTSTVGGGVRRNWERPVATARIVALPAANRDEMSAGMPTSMVPPFARGS